MDNPFQGLEQLSDWLVMAGFGVINLEEEVIHFHGSEGEIVQKLMPRLGVGDKEPIRQVMDQVRFLDFDPWELQRESRCRINGEVFLLSRVEAARNQGTFQRKTKSGKWKSTGNPREMKINDVSDKSVTRRILVFQDGRRSSGRQKTEWVAHEFRLNYGSEDARTYAIYKLMRRGELKDEADVQFVNGLGSEELRSVATAMLS